jgi:hypothetical protein
MTTSVTEFGAVGDGRTDDTEAFKEAHKAAVERGHPVVYVPPGRYLADVVMDNRASLLGARQQTVIQAVTEGKFAVTYATYIPVAQTIWQRPFVQGIALFGAGRTRGGIHIENKLGVDLIDVAVHECTTGIYCAGNYYGTWDRLFVIHNEVGIHFTTSDDNTHAGNKRIIAAQIRLNGIGVLVENRVSRTAIYGGTIEANRSGLVFDCWEADAWNDANALHLRDVWFEANNFEERGPARSLRNGASIPTGDLYVHDGTVVLQNCGASHVRIGARGRLFADFSYVGRGPVDAFLEIEEGGYFEHSHSLVPAQVVRLSPGLGTG